MFSHAMVQIVFWYRRIFLYQTVALIGSYELGQFHVRDLFLGKIHSDDGFAERLLNARFKSISRA